MTERPVARAKETVEEFESLGVLRPTHDGLDAFLPTFEREFGAPEPTSYRDVEATERLLVREYLRHHDALLWYDPREIHGLRSYERIVERFLTVAERSSAGRRTASGDVDETQSVSSADQNAKRSGEVAGDPLADAAYELSGEWDPLSDLRLTVELDDETFSESLAHLGGNADHESLAVLFDEVVREASGDRCLVSVWDDVPVVLFPPREAAGTVREYFRPDVESEIHAPDPEADDPKYVYTEGNAVQRADVIRNLDADAVEYSDLLCDALGDDDERVRIAATSTLVDHAVPGTAGYLAELLDEEESVLVRRLVPIALSMMSISNAETIDEATRPRVESALRTAAESDPDEDVRNAAKTTLFEVRSANEME